MMAIEETCASKSPHELSDAIHTLAQPLTALSFVLDLALMQKSPEAWKSALVHARTETSRAITALVYVRQIVGEPDGDEVPSWRQLQ